MTVNIVGHISKRVYMSKRCFDNVVMFLGKDYKIKQKISIIAHIFLVKIYLQLTMQKE